jgi:hypothetical protein
MIGDGAIAPIQGVVKEAGEHLVDGVVARAVSHRGRSSLQLRQDVGGDLS